jgi:hypothetical protein
MRPDRMRLDRVRRKEMRWGVTHPAKPRCAEPGREELLADWSGGLFT